MVERMRILYVNGHPDSQSFHAAIQQRYVKGIAQSANAKHEIRVLELGKQHFDPVLRYGYRQSMPEDPEIARAQEFVKWAEHIVFAFPVWWGDAPALMKGWIERVFTPGFAYATHGARVEHLLTCRTVDIIATQGGVRPLAWLYGNHFVGIFRRNLCGFTGMKVRRVLTLGGIGTDGRLDSPKRRDRFLDKVERSASALSDGRQ